MKKDIKLVEYNSELDQYNFSWNGRDGFITGKNRLLQEISKRILTSKGSNKFEPKFGENIFSIFGSFDRSKESYVKELIPVMLKNIQEDIVNRQSLDPSLEKEERLKSIDIVKAEFDEDLLGWSLVIQVVTADLSKNKFTVI
jgi:hypothetical protein